jgi:hypothetical protein
VSGQNTYTGFYVPLATASLDDDAPVSTARAWTVEQNLQHLLDMSPQVRINWTGGANDDQFSFFRAEGYSAYWSQVFLHTWISDRFPCGLDVQICAKVPTGSSMDVEARIVPLVQGASVFSPSITPYWEDDGSTSSDTSDEVINSIYYPGTGVENQRGTRAFSTVESSLARLVTVALARLEIKLTATDSAEDPYSLTRVLVREFC